ncbi:MAG: hypothetical protein H6845_02025 [Alphaproteobacteria bacterium]|nr:MAG: hypothetical protein H6845_02025 [Alphaproteobacteria bacterium]
MNRKLFLALMSVGYLSNSNINAAKIDQVGVLFNQKVDWVTGANTDQEKADQSEIMKDFNAEAAYKACLLGRCLLPTVLGSKPMLTFIADTLESQDYYALFKQVGKKILAIALDRDGNFITNEAFLHSLIARAKKGFTQVFRISKQKYADDRVVLDCLLGYKKASKYFQMKFTEELVPDFDKLQSEILPCLKFYKDFYAITDSALPSIDVVIDRIKNNLYESASNASSVGSPNSKSLLDFDTSSIQSSPSGKEVNALDNASQAGAVKTDDVGMSKTSSSESVDSQLGVKSVNSNSSPEVDTAIVGELNILQNRALATSSSTKISETKTVLTEGSETTREGFTLQRTYSANPTTQGLTSSNNSLIGNSDNTASPKRVSFSGTSILPFGPNDSSSESLNGENKTQNTDSTLPSPAHITNQGELLKTSRTIKTNDVSDPADLTYNQFALNGFKVESRVKDLADIFNNLHYSTDKFSALKLWCEKHGRSLSDFDKIVNEKTINKFSNEMLARIVVGSNKDFAELLRNAGEKGMGRYGLLHHNANGSKTFQLHIHENLNKNILDLLFKINPEFKILLNSHNNQLGYLLIHVAKDSKHKNSLVTPLRDGKYLHPFMNSSFDNLLKMYNDKNDGVEFLPCFVNIEDILPEQNEDEIRMILNDGTVTQLGKITNLFSYFSKFKTASPVVGTHLDINMEFHAYLVDKFNINVAGEDNFYNLREMGILSLMEKWLRTANIYKDDNLNTLL